MERLLFSLLILICCSNCNFKSHAEFELSNHPTIPGKVMVTDMSENVESYQWHVSLAETRNGSYSSSNVDDNLGYFSGQRTHFYAHHNGWLKVDLTTTGISNHREYSDTIEITNVPTKVTIGDLVVTRVSLMNNNSFEWDDVDGMPNNATYEVESEYPDLLVDNSYSNSGYSDNDVVWDVNIESGLPVTLPSEHTVFEELHTGAITEYRVRLVDFDGNPGFIGLQPGEVIGFETIDVYRLTHDQNHGSDDNFPDFYRIETDGFDARLHMVWE